MTDEGWMIVTSDLGDLFLEQPGGLRPGDIVIASHATREAAELDLLARLGAIPDAER